MCTIFRLLYISYQEDNQKTGFGNVLVLISILAFSRKIYDNFPPCKHYFKVFKGLWNSAGVDSAS